VHQITAKSTVQVIFFQECHNVTIKDGKFAMDLKLSKSPPLDFIGVY
jgi:hypothetical protein